MVDSYGRIIDYLRVSVTDRCNLNCCYCAPSRRVCYLAHDEIMTFEEIGKIVEVAVSLGVKKVRLTGGEPLCRKGILELYEKLAQIPGIRDISLTTNGQYLTDFLDRFAKLGLRRINISLDSLDFHRYQTITRGGQLEKTLNSIFCAMDLGFQVKINCVVLKGINDDEVDGFVNLAQRYSLTIRFIEFMPICGEVWDNGYFIPLTRVKEQIRRKFHLIPLGRDGVAENFGLGGGRGIIGFISPISQPFCSACSRLRITASGKMLPCLFSNDGIELLPILRSGADKNLLQEAFYRVLRIKPKHHNINSQEEFKSILSMKMIGG